jgi:hypothetical protein
MLGPTVETVLRPQDAQGLVLLPKRWGMSVPTVGCIRLGLGLWANVGIVWPGLHQLT